MIRVKTGSHTGSHTVSRGRSAFRGGRAAVLALGVAGAASGCDSVNNTYIEHVTVAPPDAGAESADPGSGAPAPDVAPGELDTDLLGTFGHHYWFEVDEKQLSVMNAPYEGPGGFPFADIYAPGSGGDATTFVDHLLVTAMGPTPHTADFGKVQVNLVGQSTGRPWTQSTLPNFKIDADEFVEGARIAGVEHLRLNNGIMGSIFRERLVLDIYRAVGYPAPRATHAWVSSSVWGPDVKVPYIAVEAYKRQFCRDREAELGGGCVNMWEFFGDFGQGAFDLEQNCQLSECDSTRASELDELVSATPSGPGFKAALADYIDWDAFHRFQCLSWILQTNDDYIHAANNLLIVERADGKFQFLPYSVDLSLDYTWGFGGGIAGTSVLPTGCQSDPTCWADTIATCEVMVDAFAAAEPVAMLDAIYAELEAASMLRSGDGDRYRILKQSIERRLQDLPVELEQNRDGPQTSCDFPLVPCGGACVFPEECFPCGPDPAGIGLGPAPGGDAGVPQDVPPPVGCIPVEPLYQ